MSCENIGWKTFMQLNDFNVPTSGIGTYSLMFYINGLIGVHYIAACTVCSSGDPI